VASGQGRRQVLFPVSQQRPEPCLLSSRRDDLLAGALPRHSLLLRGRQKGTLHHRNCFEEAPHLYIGTRKLDVCQAGAFEYPAPPGWPVLPGACRLTVCSSHSKGQRGFIRKQVANLMAAVGMALRPCVWPLC
jgi:hypothetical protein